MRDGPSHWAVIDTLVPGLITLVLGLLPMPVSAVAQAIPRAHGVSSRVVRFSTSEGTWMSVDVSPDGRWIVFDLLGDLYRLPAAGGHAAHLTSGAGFDAQPRYSGDGRRIVFVSDRSGMSNVWTTDANGARLQQLTHDTAGAYISPAWAPDGRSIIVSKRLPEQVIAATLRRLHVHPDGDSLVVDAVEDLWRPHGRFTAVVGAVVASRTGAVYVAVRQADTGPQADSREVQWQIMQYRNASRSWDTVTATPGGAMRPTLSPDGRYMVYASRTPRATALRLRDLRSDADKLLTEIPNQNGAIGAFDRDLMPGSAFTPDGRAVVAWYGGHLHELDIMSGKDTIIPFTADVEKPLAPLAKFSYRIDDSARLVRQIRDAQPSPNGRRLAFTVLDQVWVMDLPNGRPRRLTPTDVGAASPAWSPDGSHIAYVTWSARTGGRLWEVRADGAASAESLTSDTALYDKPAYATDGKAIFAVRYRLRDVYQPDLTVGTDSVDLVRVSLAGGAPHVLARFANAPGSRDKTYGRPQPSRDGRRVFLYTAVEGLVEISADGTKRTRILSVQDFYIGNAPYHAEDIHVSPDATQLLVQFRQHAYLVALPVAHHPDSAIWLDTLHVLGEAGRLAASHRITPLGGEFASWDLDGRGIHYSLGASYFSIPVDSAIRRPEAYRRTDVSIAFRPDRALGTLVLHGARLVTMHGDQVIPQGDIVIRDGRIVAVGAIGSVPVPPNAYVVDVSGKTILPGYVDIHAHPHEATRNNGVHTPQPWDYLSYLAYGVTTIRDPQSETTDVFSYADQVERGAMLGPRVLTTGPGVFWYEDIRSVEDARAIARRYADFFRTETLKVYAPPLGNRAVIQWLAQAAYEHQLTPTSHSTGLVQQLCMVLDGYAGQEHAYAGAPLYDDVVQLVARSAITNTPTLVIGWNVGDRREDLYETYFRHDGLHAEVKLRRFWPPARDQSMNIPKEADDDADFPFARAVATLAAGGARIGLGGHGQAPGLDSHWELWLLAKGGMSPRDVLRTGTIVSAEAIGHERDIGSIEPGKLADLQILDKNPLDDIYNTNTVHYVVKDGRLYDADTLDELWPRRRTLAL